MKYSEFKAEVEKLGWFVSGNKYEVHVINDGGGKLMVIDKTDTHVLDPGHIQYVSLTHEDKSVLLDLSVKLAKTPLTEREEEKRYWLQRIEPPILGEQDPRYLFYTRVGGYYDIGTTKSEWRNVIKTIFTESEIAEMDITGFKKEPVE